jgi:hypothetical protein
MAKSIDAPEQGKVTAPPPVVYLFRQNGTVRVYEVDALHLNAMRFRSDLTYVGTIPLPSLKKEEQQ